MSSPPLLTKAQERAVHLLLRYSWATQAVHSHKPFWAHGHKIPWNIVEKLRALGLVQRETIGPGKPFPDGTRNHSRILIYIICLTKKAKALYD